MAVHLVPAAWVGRTAGEDAGLLGGLLGGLLCGLLGVSEGVVAGLDAEAGGLLVATDVELVVPAAEGLLLAELEHALAKVAMLIAAMTETVERFIRPTFPGDYVK